MFYYIIITIAFLVFIVLMINCTNIIYYTLPRLLKEKKKSNLLSGASFITLAAILTISIIFIISFLLIVLRYFPDLALNTKVVFFIALAIAVNSSLKEGKEKLKLEFEKNYGEYLISGFNIESELEESLQKLAIKKITNNNIKEFIKKSNNDELAKSILDWNTKDFFVLHSSTYSKLLEKLTKGDLQVVEAAVLDYKPLLMKLIADKKQLSRYRRQIILWPLIGAFIVLLGAIWFNNYWLISVLFAYPVAQFLSGNFGLFKMIKTFVFFTLLILSGYAVLMSNFQLLCISIPIIIWLNNFTALRENYREVIRDAALISETAFLFLCRFDYIDIFDVDNQTFIKLNFD